MWYLTACKISVSLLFLNGTKTEMIFHPISELMLVTLIQKYDKKSFHFKNERLSEVLRLSDAIFYYCINKMDRRLIANMNFHEKFVVVPADKASSNIVFAKHTI